MTAKHAAEAVLGGAIVGVVLGVVAWLVVSSIGDGPEFPY